MSSAAVLDLTGGHLDVRCDPDDDEAFMVAPTPDLTAFTFECTGGVVVEPAVDHIVVRIPAAVTSAIRGSTSYSVAVVQQGRRTTLLTGKLFT